MPVRGKDWERLLPILEKSATTLRLKEIATTSP
jgi:hypothetical protein